MQDVLINITDKCINCRRCIKVCPSKIFIDNPNGGSPVTQNEQSCIKCGHCVAACAVGAVKHNLFEQSKIHKIDYSQMPTPEQVMLLCRVRRTNRSFTDKPVPQEHIDMILEAAHRAPTASNMQEIEFLVITSQQKIRQVQQYVIDVFGSFVKKLENPLLKPLLKHVIGSVYRYVPIFYRMKEQFEQGNDLVLRGAPVLLLIHAPKSSRFADADANLAYQNASLMAESLGISQLYTGFLCTAIKMGRGKFEKMIGLPSDRSIKAGMGFGIPEFRYPNYIDKKELQVIVEK